jgi:2'-5' RNA ligase
LTLDDQPNLRELVAQYQRPIADLPNLDIIPSQWLHVTMQGIGFADEVTTTDVEVVTERLREELRGPDAPTVTFHEASIESEAALLKAMPPEPLYQLRLHMYDAIASVLAPSNFSEPRPEPRQFKPHVSLAYVNQEGQVQPIADALNIVDAHPVTVTFRKASLLVFHRDHQMYEWTQATPLPIGHR